MQLYPITPHLADPATFNAKAQGVNLGDLVIDPATNGAGVVVGPSNNRTVQPFGGGGGGVGPMVLQVAGATAVGGGSGRIRLTATVHAQDGTTPVLKAMVQWQLTDNTAPLNVGGASPGQLLGFGASSNGPPFGALLVVATDAAGAATIEVAGTVGDTVTPSLVVLGGRVSAGLGGDGFVLPPVVLS